MCVCVCLFVCVCVCMCVCVYVCVCVWILKYYGSSILLKKISRTVSHLNVDFGACLLHTYRTIAVNYLLILVRFFILSSP